MFLSRVKKGLVVKQISPIIYSQPSFGSVRKAQQKERIITIVNIAKLRYLFAVVALLFVFRSLYIAIKIKIIGIRLRVCSVLVVLKIKNIKVVKLVKSKKATNLCRDLIEKLVSVDNVFL